MSRASHMALRRPERSPPPGWGFMKGRVAPSSAPYTHISLRPRRVAGLGLGLATQRGPKSGLAAQRDVRPYSRKGRPPWRGTSSAAGAARHSARRCWSAAGPASHCSFHAVSPKPSGSADTDAGPPALPPLSSPGPIPPGRRGFSKLNRSWTATPRLFATDKPAGVSPRTTSGGRWPA